MRSELLRSLRRWRFCARGYGPSPPPFAGRQKETDTRSSWRKRQFFHLGRQRSRSPRRETRRSCSCQQDNRFYRKAEEPHTGAHDGFMPMKILMNISEDRQEWSLLVVSSLNQMPVSGSGAPKPSFGCVGDLLRRRLQQTDVPGPSNFLVSSLPKANQNRPQRSATSRFFAKYKQVK
jgi:hypothetical protein